MKKLFVSVMIVVCAMIYTGAAIAAPVAPTMTLSTQGQSVSISWTPVQGATGYTLAYAQYPWLATMTMNDIHSDEHLIFIMGGSSLLRCRSGI